MKIILKANLLKGRVAKPEGTKVRKFDHVNWRKKAIRLLKPYHPQRIMDVATGTGDFAIQACQMLQQIGRAHV